MDGQAAGQNPDGRRPVVEPANQWGTAAQYSPNPGGERANATVEFTN